ncbi:gamma-glutamyltransferase [Acetobacteraceae bacterium ESL0709]|nr:gamma-glutamyltransferase [Acetobacteraceae bacterium ESL0697]MDF7678902.1 gamma-glutamyltransferase [Acetobacteraceae bacterium ESL0709]
MAQHQSPLSAQSSCLAPHAARKPVSARKSHKRKGLFLAAALSGLLLSGCADVHVLELIHPNTPPGGGGIVVADEPQAALVGRDVLARGGNAADAATATAFALGVTLPSRASLGGGGACLISHPGQVEPHAVTFLPEAGSGEGDRPAAVPMMARGLYLLQLHYGAVQFSDTIDPAINLAQQGINVSKPLADDLAVVRGPLLDDSAALAVFGKEGDNIVNIGDLLVQTRLASFLSRLKLVGVGDLYNGALAQVFIDQAQKAGAGLTRDDLRNALPSDSAALYIYEKGYRAAVLPPPADGGLGALMALKYNIPAESAVQAWRQSGLKTVKQARSFMEQEHSSPTPLPPLPASTTFIVRDHAGLVVACALTDYNLFGTGRVAGTTGVVLGASPRNYPKPLLIAAATQTTDRKVRAILTASGLNQASQDVADSIDRLVHGKPFSTSDTTRMNAIICENGRCAGMTDPHGNGLSTWTKAPH